MERAKLELMVGVFVFVGVACLGYLSIKLGKLGSHWGKQLRGRRGVHIGLRPEAGASVEIAGVEVGRVRQIG